MSLCLLRIIYIISFNVLLNEILLFQESLCVRSCVHSYNDCDFVSAGKHKDLVDMICLAVPANLEYHNHTHLPNRLYMLIYKASFLSLTHAHTYTHTHTKAHAYT